MANQPTKYRKFVVGAASAALVASAVAPVAFAAEFTDTKGNTHETAIDALSNAGVITGYEDGTFKPNKTLTRSDVVKLMGKWLVAEGYKVPADYKTKPRFADLKTTSNDELLQMSALVYDNGVFVGKPDGTLDPTSDITRENMAIVLVRAFDRVYDVDLVSYVKAQDFKKDVTDLGKAKAEARPAIDVLDFFDITNPAAPEFNPKNTTTRGQFASFLYKTTKVDFDEVGGGVVAPGVATVKGINATTVEVTFKDEVKNMDSLKFSIDGLTVSNAAVKQTDNKTVVLTTATQKGGEKYTVSLNGEAIGSFTGIEATIPTSIKINNESVQGKTGQQVILAADVGVKKAGIPVTFNVKANTIGTTNKDQVFEVTTNEDGIATFSYTQYSAGTDQVTAYPTGAPTVRDTGYVFWGVDTILAVEEVTVGNTINNGANKTYKIVHKNATTGKPVSGKVLNVSLLENVNVTPDKLSNATVNGVKVSQLNSEDNAKTATVTTDSKGEATFTVSGSNTSATPIVFDRNVVGKESTYEASLLQAKANTVTFTAQQVAYAIELTRDGGDIAAKGASNGRKYDVVVKDKDGNIAKNETVNVAFNEDLDRVITTNTQAQFIKKNADGTQVYAGTQISVKTDNEGKASFIIGSDNENDYATPIAWIDINTPNAVEGKLDQGEPFTIGSISYFKAAYLDGAALKVYNGNKETSTFKGSETATFKASLVNQSNKDMANTSIKTATYTVFNTGANDVVVAGQTVSPNRSYTVTQTAPNTNLQVKPSQDKNASVRVVATGIAIDTDGKDYAFTAKEATATFTSSTQVSDLYTGVVKSYDTKKEELTFDGKDAVKYAGEKGKTYEYKGIGNTPIATSEDFIKELKKGKVTVTREVKDNKVTFYIIEQTAGNPPTDVTTPDVVVPSEGLVFTSAVAEAANDSVGPGFGAVAYDIQGTVADAGVSEVKLTFTGEDETVTETVPVVDGKIVFKKSMTDFFGYFNKVSASYTVNGVTKTTEKDLVLRIIGEAQITETTIDVDGKTIGFTDIVGANAKLDLKTLAPTATATDITVTVTEDSTFSMTYGNKTKSVELTRGENQVSTADLFPGLNPSTTLTVGFLQNLQPSGTLEVATKLVAGGVTKTGTLTISYDPKQ